MTQSTSESLTYAQAGVDIDEGERLVDLIKPAAKSTARPGAEAALGGFAAAFDPKVAGFRDPIFLATTDGVGTKLKIAIESGRHETVGIDLVAMCVNDISAQGAEPLMFLDYYATSKLDADQAAIVVRGIAEGCRQAGAALAGGETAEMPGMYAKGDYDLAGFAIGAAERGTLLPRPAQPAAQVADEGSIGALVAELLAGGLDAANVTEAVGRTGARFVDVASGVESAPGIKDVDKIAAFLKAAADL